MVGLSAKYQGAPKAKPCVWRPNVSSRSKHALKEDGVLKPTAEKCGAPITTKEVRAGICIWGSVVC